MDGIGRNPFALLSGDDSGGNENTPPSLTKTASGKCGVTNPSSTSDFPPLLQQTRQSTHHDTPAKKPLKALLVTTVSGRGITPARSRPGKPKLYTPAYVPAALSAPCPDDNAANARENWCGVCFVKFTSKLALQNHVKQLPGHDNYCNLCRRVFKDRNGLKNHVDNAANHDVSCNLCLSAFNDKLGLRNHFENNYTVGHAFACLTCLQGFNTHEQMQSHLRNAARHVRCETITLHRCWLCEEPMQSQTLLIKHLETGKCGLPISATDLLQILGKWWYSTLYMDIDVHAQIRRGRVDISTLIEWIGDGLIMPYICRAEGCGKQFGRFSSLVFHAESGECEWIKERMHYDMLEKEVKRSLREAGRF